MATKRTFAQVADAIHRSNATASEAVSRGVSIEIQESNLTLAHALASAFEDENPRFKRRLFLRACGYATNAQEA